MADATLTRVEVIDGVLHIFGANFTQTTTSVLVDDSETPHVYVSATELTVDPAPAPGSQISVMKAGVESEAVEVPAAEAAGEAGGAGSADAPPAGGSEGNTGQAAVSKEDFLTEQDKAPKTETVAKPPVENVAVLPEDHDYTAGGEEAAPARQAP